MLSHKTAQARERLEAGADWHDMGFVVPRPDGRPLWPQGVDRQLKALFKKAGLPVFSAHVMRHTQQITLDLYSHVIPGMQRAAADRLEDMLFRQDGKLRQAEA